MEERTYNINELALMTGFTTRTLRNYLLQGFLKGEKTDGAWQFTVKNIESFLEEPYVKEGLRIKRSGRVFDFLADRKKDSARACVILDLPASLMESKALSDFFCEQMNHAANVDFTLDRDNGVCRVILTGAQDQVTKIIQAYCSRGVD